MRYTVLIFCYLATIGFTILLRWTWRFKTSAFLIYHNVNLAGPTLNMNTTLQILVINQLNAQNLVL